MKKLLILSTLFIAVVACNKTTSLPAYSAPTHTNLTVSSLKHSTDTVNVGDTVYLTATGTVFDTLAVYAYFSVSSTSTGNPVYSIGSSSSPIKLSTVLGSQNVSGMNNWTSTIALTKITNVSNTKLTITGNFSAQLTLSSQGASSATVADAGQSTKTIYIR